MTAAEPGLGLRLGLVPLTPHAELKFRVAVWRDGDLVLAGRENADLFVASASDGDLAEFLAEQGWGWDELAAWVDSLPLIAD